MGKVHSRANRPKQVIRIGNPVKGAKIIVLGLTFKEDVPDLRNLACHRCDQRTEELRVQVFVQRPVPIPRTRAMSYGLELVSWDELPKAEAMWWPSPIANSGAWGRNVRA